MKKKNSFKGRGRIVFAFLLTLGLSLFASMNVEAQSVADIDARITKYTTLQSTFNSGSAKWVNVQSVITHLQNVKNGLSANPNYVADVDTQALSPNNPIWLKVNPSVLKTYTTAQLSTFQGKVSQMEGTGDTSSASYKKLKAILEANAY